MSAVEPGGVLGATPTTVAGVPYLAVELADAVDPRILGDLAATFAVFERRGRPAAAGRGAGRRTVRRRPAHHPQVPGQDQRAADPGPAQRHARLDGPAGPDPPDRARPAGRSGDDAQLGADPRARRRRCGGRAARGRGLHGVPHHLAAPQAREAPHRTHPAYAATDGGSATCSRRRSAATTRSRSSCMRPTP